MFRWAILVGLTCLGASGCTSDTTFQCVSDEQCKPDGFCESNDYCSFPDAECSSGKRYGSSAATGIAGQCVPVEMGSTSAAGSSSSMTIGGETSTSASATTGGLESSSSGSSGLGSTSTSTEEDDSTSTSSGLGSSSSSSSSSGRASTSTGETTLDCVEDNGNDCGGCFSCVTGPSQACEALSTNCDDTLGCPQIAACLAACTAQGLCFEDCCEGEAGEAVESAVALEACQREACVSATCFGLPTAECTTL